MATTSQNIEKNIIPRSASTIDTQKGKNKIESKTAPEKQILRIIGLYYTLLLKITN